MKRVYFLRPVGQIGPIKIGCSIEPDKRLETYLPWSPVKLELIAAVPGTHGDERKLHGMFMQHWLHHEWFAASKELLALLEYVALHGRLPALPEGKVIPIPRPKRAAGARAAHRVTKAARVKRGPSPRAVRFGEALRPSFEAGATLQELADLHDVCLITVRRALLSVGATMRPRGGQRGLWDTARAEEFRQRRLSGQTLQEIGDAFSLTRERVRQVLNKLNSRVEAA